MSENVSQHQVVVQAMKQMIASGEVRPGDRLPVEADLAETLGVSRGSLREGVRALVAMGILETRQGSGTTVTSLEPDLLLEPFVFWCGLQEGSSAQHAHAARRALEVEAAGLAAARISDTELEELAAELTGAEKPIAAHDHERAMHHDLAFHLRIARATGNPVLVALIDALGQPTLRSRMWQSLHASGRLEAAHAEHGAILGQLVAHDPVAARTAMHTHLMLSGAHLPS